MLFPHSLGIFYTAVTQWLGFPHYGDEGKVMGLAPYGDAALPRRDARDRRTPNGDLFELDLDYFTHHSEGVDMTWDERHADDRAASSRTRLEEALRPGARARRASSTSLHEDVAASLQAVLEEVYLHLVARAAGSGRGSRSLCLAGGVALNAVANGRIRPETPFEEVYVQPAAGDSGTAVGAAYYVWHQVLGEPRGFVMEHAYTGPGYYDDEDCAGGARRGRARGGAARRRRALPARSRERIAAGDVVGWFQGRMEFGPRALGNRSIVADPRRADMKDILNARIKHREPFRPFAPSVLAERDRRVVRAGLPVAVHGARLQDARREARADPGGQPRRRHRPPADGRGRESNPRYYRLIEEFERQTGVPIVLNTSFNENEPIVMTPAQALDTFLKTRMDLLVLGNYVVRRSGRSADDGGGAGGARRAGRSRAVAARAGRRARSGSRPRAARRRTLPSTVRADRDADQRRTRRHW